MSTAGEAHLLVKWGERLSWVSASYKDLATKMIVPMQLVDLYRWASSSLLFLLDHYFYTFAFHHCMVSMSSFSTPPRIYRKLFNPITVGGTDSAPPLTTRNITLNQVIWRQGPPQNTLTKYVLKIIFGAPKGSPLSPPLSPYLGGHARPSCEGGRGLY